jgi:RNA recognition motif-containing protein
MGKNIFVGNLSSAVTEDTLRQRFEEIGPCVSVQIIKDKMTGQPKGFGFVEMENEGDAQQAIAKINGVELGGKKLTVNEARPRQDRGGGGGGGFGRPRFGGGGGGGGGRRRF